MIKRISIAFFILYPLILNQMFDRGSGRPCYHQRYQDFCCYVRKLEVRIEPGVETKEHQDPHDEKDREHHQIESSKEFYICHAFNLVSDVPNHSAHIPRCGSRKSR